jgi:hypothetical protein
MEAEVVRRSDKTWPDLQSQRRSYFTMLMMVAWVNSSSPSRPSSAPKPDCFTPPNWVSAPMSKFLLPQTVPETILAATPNVRSRSDDQTEPPRPNNGR